MNRFVSSLSAAAFAVGLLAGSASATTITDDFTTSHDYLTQGVAGTIWDGALNAGNAVTANVNTSNVGQLTVTLGSTAGYGWDAGAQNAPFLYKNVSAGNDFVAEMKVTAATFASYVVPGLLVYKDDSNFVGGNANHFDGAGWPFGFVQGRSVVGGVQSDTAGQMTQFNSDPVYLKMAYTAATSTLNLWSSFDGASWTQQKWGNDSYDLVRTDLTGTLKVGVALSDYVPGAGNTAQVDSFSLTTVPEPCTLLLAVTSLLGLLAYAWRKRN